MLFGFLLEGRIVMCRHGCDGWRMIDVLCILRREEGGEEEGNPAGWFVAVKGRGSVDSLNCGRKIERESDEKGGSEEFMKILPGGPKTPSPQNR